MIPGMIASGYRGIAVVFDVWGLAGMVASGVKKAREIAEESAEKAASGETKEVVAEQKKE